MRLLFSAVLLSLVVIGSVSVAYAISDEDRMAKLQKGIDKLMDRIQMLEDKKDKIDKRINTLQDKVDRKQANIDRINGIEPAPPEPFIKTDKTEYEIGETIHVTGLKIATPEQHAHPFHNPHNQELDIDSSTWFDEIMSWSIADPDQTQIWEMCYFHTDYGTHGYKHCDERPEMIQNDDGTFTIDILLTEDNSESGTYHYFTQMYQGTYKFTNGNIAGYAGDSITSPPFLIK